MSCSNDTLSKYSTKGRSPKGKMNGLGYKKIFFLTSGLENW